MTETRSLPRNGSCCFDIGNHLSIRLYGASNSEYARLAGQFGPCSNRSFETPDIAIRFVPSIGNDGLKTLGPFGYSDDGYLILQSKDCRSRLKVDLRRLGESESELLCQGPPDMQFLESCLALAAVRKGLLILHASAFVHEGRGCLVTGWPGGGKSAALLAFLLQDARYLSDDKVMISSDGGWMWGINPRLDVSESQLRPVVPNPRALSLRQILALQSLRRLDGLNTHFFRRRFLGERAARAAERAVSGVKNRFVLRVDPTEAFGVEVQAEARPEKIFVLLKDGDRGVSISRLSEEQLINRIAPIIEHDQLRLRQAYLAWKFAFPGLKNPLIEDLPERLGGLACRALQRKDAYLVRHPYGCGPNDLFEAMTKCIRDN